MILRQHQGTSTWPFFPLPTPPVGISGMAWFQPLSEPIFKKAMPAWLQPPVARTLVPASLISSIQGIAWYKPWEPPYFLKSYRAWLQPQSAVALTPATLPPQIRGIAWYRQFDIPKQKRVDPYLQPFGQWVVKLPYKTRAYGYIIGPG